MRFTMSMLGVATGLILVVSACSSSGETEPAEPVTSVQTATSQPATSQPARKPFEPSTSTSVLTATSVTSTTAVPVTAPAGVTPIYLTIFSHNERTITRYGKFRDNFDDYLVYRRNLIDVAELLHRYGVHYGWQTDYLIIEAMDNFEDEALALDPAATGGKPILRYLVEDLGVSVDPHAHECITPPNRGDCGDRQYNYADVAYVIGKLGGVEPTGVIGGTSEAERTVADFGSCIEGNVYDFSWCPDVLTGYAGVSGGHANDDHHSGVWRPTEFNDTDFLINDPGGPLANVGRGYSLGAFSGTSFGFGGPAPLDYIEGLAERLRTGEAEPGRVYTATLNFNEDQFIENNWLGTLEGILVRLQPLVDEGRVIYTNFVETVDIWKNVYRSEPNIYAY